MNKEVGLQLELFSGQDKQTESVPRIKNSSFLTRIRNSERIILIIIGIVATAIISFSLGVENGKRLTLLNNNSRYDIGIKTKQVLPNRVVKQEPPAITQPLISPVKSEPDKQAFTIQLASYKTKTYAEKEAQVLKKRGLSPIVLTKGNYTVLCVGIFSNKEKAQSLLSQLEKRYTGCRIRRL